MCPRLSRLGEEGPRRLGPGRIATASTLVHRLTALNCQLRSHEARAPSVGTVSRAFRVVAAFVARIRPATKAHQPVWSEAEGAAA